MSDAAAPYGLPRVMSGHVRAVEELLAPSEVLTHAAIARLTNPSWRDVVEAAREPTTLVVKGAVALNEVPGGLLGLTSERLVYVARTLVGRAVLDRGNERIQVPLTAIRGARYQRGVGAGDIRRIASIVLYGSKLWVDTADGELAFIEIKPLNAAETMATTITNRPRE